MLLLQHVVYAHPNRDILFSDIDLVINKHDKLALIGNNGVGKSTLLKILSGELQPSKGTITRGLHPYYIPQVYGQFNELTVAQALKVDHKIQALHKILGGDVNDAYLETLEDDWTIEERCHEALAYWQPGAIDLNREMRSLSGGQKTKVFLAGIWIHRPGIILLDEPSNHLDLASRTILYDYIRSTSDTLVVVSHDRIILNSIDTVCELSKQGLTIYGGNFDFYQARKLIQSEAFIQELKSKEKALRKARETERASLERKQKLDARGKRKQEKAGVPTITMNSLRNNAEKSTSKIKAAHTEKIDIIAGELNVLRKELPGIDTMKLDLANPLIHQGKILITAEQVNFKYNDRLLWEHPLSFQIRSGDRIAIKGANGTGKTTILKLITGELSPEQGTLVSADFSSLYIDQDYSIIDNSISVYDQVQLYNDGQLQEHEIKSRLNRFLFSREFWHKPCGSLSGGEKMRLILCCITTRENAPDVILLDEPTNNLDIRNVEILTDVMSEYKGSLIVVSHDEFFLQELRINGEIVLKS